MKRFALRIKFEEASETQSYPTNLLSRDQKDFMAGLLNALLGSSDTDIGAGVVRSWNSNLGGRLQFQLLQLLAVFTDDKAMVLLRDGDRG